MTARRSQLGAAPCAAPERARHLGADPARCAALDPARCAGLHPTGGAADHVRRAAADYVRRGRSECGQASIEVVILAPIVVAVVLAAAQLLAAGAAGELADHAAEAGAVALLQGDDPAAAARDAVPGWSRKRMTVRVDGRRVRVRMRPPSPFPGLAGTLESSREADAGPEPR